MDEGSDRSAGQAAGAIEIARQYPPLTVSLTHATAAVESVLGSIGDACPELPAGRRLTVGTVPLHGECSTEFDYVGRHSELAASGFYNRGVMGEKGLARVPVANLLTGG